MVMNRTINSIHHDSKSGIDELISFSSQRFKFHHGNIALNTRFCAFSVSSKLVLAHDSYTSQRIYTGVPKI